MEDLRLLYFTYMRHLGDDPCGALHEVFGSSEVGRGWYGFLLKDNCRWLRTFLFNTSQSWYLAYGFLERVQRLRLGEYSSTAYVWSLAYETGRGLAIELYNVLSGAQLRALVERVRGFTARYRVFALLMGRAVTT